MDMIAEELVNHMIPPLKLKDDAHKAMLWMEELRSNELPVVDNEKFMGLITEDLILEANDVEMSVADLKPKSVNCYVSKGSHFFEVIKMASDHGAQMVGVVDEEGIYIGVITVQDTITSFAQSAAVQLPGGIVVISLKQIDYSLAEISRLIEENSAKVLSASVKEDELDPSRIKLTIKINRLDLTAVIATLERFGYQIIASYQEPKIMDDKKDRIDMFLRYLDI